ncbi:gephyrin-like molybdotransferase receptor GlpR [uncultured Williamsia sp.]|uniref:divisome protein SepX/GlpR n=1 Tax=uncultured Williamsia sp. TaxID=259311 RepID=UPI00261F426E|nr:gephyrin-like molybdotransferase receptor GlpR [uncultured Williamsia sp.]
MPNSVLWICLVAIWLFVLVPMLIKGRPELRKPTQATLATRVIDRGGKAMSRATRRIAAGRHPHDAGWVAPEREYRKAGDLINEADDHVDARRERVSARTATAVADLDETTDSDNAPADGESDGPVVDLDAIHLGKPRVENVTRTEETDDADALIDADSELETDEDLADDADLDSGDDLSDDDLSDEVEDFDDVSDDIDDAHDEPARRGRGGYDPAADTRRSEKRYRARQRTVLLLAVLSLAGLGVGIALGGLAWAATGVTVGLLVLYMAFLRRAVRIEEQIRRRRAARATRAPRRHRDFDDVGDPFADEIPFHLRRPGAVVLEIDDEHPVFDHLPPFQHRRMMREEPDYRRAVGQ